MIAAAPTIVTTVAPADMIPMPRAGPRTKWMSVSAT